MKVVLAGAYGNLGADIFRSLLAAGHEVVAADMAERDIGVSGNYTRWMSQSRKLSRGCATAPTW